MPLSGECFNGGKNPRPADVLASCGKPMAPAQQRGNFTVDQVDEEDEDLGCPKKGRGKGRGRGRGKGRGRGRPPKKESKRPCSDSEECHDPEASGSSATPAKKKKQSAATTSTDSESKLAKGETHKRSKSRASSKTKTKGKDVDKTAGSSDKPPKSKSVPPETKPEKKAPKRKSKSLGEGVTQVRQNQDQTQMPSLRPAALGNLLPRVLGSLRQRQRVPSLASLPRKVVPQSQTQRPRRDPAKAVPTMLPAKRHSKKAKLKRKPLKLARRLG